MKKNVVVKQPMVNFANADFTTSSGGSGFLISKNPLGSGGGG
jgi:hypothetical protein